MKNKSENIFTKIRKDEDKELIFDELARAKREILVKQSVAGGDLFIGKAISYFRKQLTCELNLGNRKIQTFNSAIIQFNSTSDKFLAQLKCNIKNNSITLDTEADLFQLHRREDFRLRLPKSYNAKFHTKKHNGSPNKSIFKILDISAGGLRLEVKSELIQLKKDDIIEGEIIFANKENLPAKLQIKHVAPAADDTTIQLIGSQFYQQTNIEKNSLVKIVMDIYRELFARL